MRARGLLLAMTIEQLFDSLSVRLKSEEVGGVTLTINWDFTDISEKWILGVSNRTLFYTQGRHEATAAATVTIARSTLLRIVIQETTFVDELQSGAATIDGDATSLLTIFGNLDAFPGSFAIVEP